MPVAYTKYQLQRAKDEMALERPHICNGCGAKWPLSHSHLVKASRDNSLYVNKLNMVYHCLDTADKVGCHTKFESPEVATMNDFEANFKIIHKLDREYFWIRIFKLEETWKIRDIEVWKRVRSLMSEIDNSEHKR